MTSVSFVADDLTGACDVLAQAHRYGLDAVLVVGDEGPLPADADVVGIAGPIRSASGSAFDDLVRTYLARIAGVDADVLIYKVCSTFDSSPTVGSIGRGIELLHERYPEHGPIAVVPAQPEFGRYTAFGNHFARSSDAVDRLDRHPVMSRHPSSPMHEADLRLVLAEQLTTHSTMDVVSLPAYADGSFHRQWARRRAEPAPAFVVDAVEEHHLDEVARALRADAQQDSCRPAIVVGSGGIMAALARTASGREPRTANPGRASGPVLAVSASASATTAAQLADAIDNGWADVAVPAELLDGHDPALLASVEQRTTAALAAGRDVVVHTTRGTDDPRYTASRRVDPAHVGTLLGSLAARMVTEGRTRDVAVCGGDTSSHALVAMGVRQLRVSDQFVTVGPICRSDDRAAVAGCRLLLKGGQAGPTDVLRRFAAREAG
jgi:uncharacterized protein YgbK (DUF1537 family)